MSTKMNFRRARPADFDQLMNLYRQLQPGDPVLTDGSDRRVFDQILASPLLCIFLLEIDSSVIASCYLNVIPNITRSAAPYAIIENVITDDQHRQRGYGRTLLEQTLAYAWDQGCYKAMLQTGSKRPATHAFYRACGFSADDKTGYVARPLRNATH